MKRFTLLLILICLFSISSQAKTTKSITTGVWSSSSTWDNGVPGAADSAIVQNGNAVTITSSTNVNYLIIEGNGSSLTLNGGVVVYVFKSTLMRPTANNQSNSLIVNGTLTCGTGMSPRTENGFTGYTVNVSGSGIMDIRRYFFIANLSNGSMIVNISCTIISYDFYNYSTGALSSLITNISDSIRITNRIILQAVTVAASGVQINMNNANARILLEGTFLFTNNGGQITQGAAESIFYYSNFSNYSSDSRITYKNMGCGPSSTLTANVDLTKLDGSFYIQSGSTLNTNGNDITIPGHLVHNGTLTMNSGDKIILDGSAAQTITVGASATAIPGLEIANTSGGVSIASGSSNLQISELLSFDASGNTAFTTNGKLVMLDGGSGMANVGNLNNHTISGNITCQFKTNTLTNIDYRLMSMPVSGVTIGDIQYHATNQTGGFETYGFTGSNTPSAGGYFSTYTYDNTQVGTLFTEGFVGATNTTNSLNHLNASTWYIGPGSGGSGASSYNFEVTGAPNTGTVVINSANGANMTAVGTGFNPELDWVLIGNPYPSTATLTNGSFINIDPSAWQFKADAGGYVEDKTLPPFQGFYVFMTGGVGSVTFNESNKVTTQKVYQKSWKNNDMVKIYIHSEHTKKWSFTSVQVKNGATNDYEAGRDARRIVNPYPWPNIALITEDNVASQRYYGAESNGHLTIPLNTMTYKSGNHTLRFEDVSKLNGCLVLEDVLENKMIPIDDVNNTYAFYLSDTVKKDRFKVHIYNFAKEVNTTNASCFAKNDGMVELNLFDLGSDYFYTLSDAKGNSIKTEFAAKGKQTIKNLAPGKYTFEVQSNGIACPTSEEYFSILEPSEMIPDFGYKGNSTVFFNNKEIEFENKSQGGIANYIWEFGDKTFDTRQTPTHLYTEPGIYTITLTTQNGNADCDVSASRTINVINAYLSVSELSDDNVDVVQLSDKMNVTTKTSFDNFEIVDLSGKLLSEGNVENQKDFQIDLSELKAGIYILHLSGVGVEKSFTLKFYKK